MNIDIKSIQLAKAQLPHFFRENLSEVQSNLVRKYKKTRRKSKKRLKDLYKTVAETASRFHREDGDLEDLLGRKIFAKEIAEKIHREHIANKSVVLAISARWGSGKTKLLEYIRPELTNRGFKVVMFNAWKYSQEPLSLKRSFLKTLNTGLGSKINLDDLHFDSTRVGINWTILGFLVCISMFLFFLPFIFDALSHNDLTTYFLSTDQFVQKSLNSWESFYIIWVSPYFFINSVLVAFIFVPLLALLAKMFSFDKSLAKITETDEFEQKFDKIIGRTKRAVVFVDDLDRCTPKAVKDILDALTTFFDHKKCSFIVTGDHTVIERYVGSMLFIEPDVNSDGAEDKKSLATKQKAEGRRFLKKIFHVYWQLPEPDPNSFKNFTSQRVGASGLILDAEQEQQLTKLLTSFLDKNLREVERFVDSLIFTHNTIKNMIEEKEKVITKLNLDVLEKKVSEMDIKNLKTVLSQPVLLAKTLLIQELFYPIYELHVQNHSDIILQEKALRVTKKLDTIFTKPINSYFYHNIQDQNKYIDLIKSQPTFTGVNNETKFDTSTFWYLSGVTGLPSNRGPDPDRFLLLIKLPDSFSEIEESLKEASVDMVANLLDITKEFIKSAADPADKQNSILNSVRLALSYNEWASLSSYLLNIFKNENYIATIDPIIKEPIMTHFITVCIKNNQEVETIFTEELFSTSEMNSYKWSSLSMVSSFLHSDTIDKYAGLIESSLKTAVNPSTEVFTNLGTLAKRVNPDDLTAKASLIDLLKKVIDWAYLQNDILLFKAAISTVININISPSTEIRDHAISKQNQSLESEEWENIQNRLPFLATEVSEFYGRKYLNQHISSYLTKLLEQNINHWQPIVTDLLNKKVITKDTSLSSIGEKLFSYLQSNDPIQKQSASVFLIKHHELIEVELDKVYILNLVNLVKDEKDVVVLINLLNLIEKHVKFLKGNEKEKNIIRKLAKSDDQGVSNAARAISDLFTTRRKKEASMEAIEADSTYTS